SGVSSSDLDVAEEGAEYVITKHRHQDKNLRSQLERFIVRAGLKPWPKLFQNLRASRATELAAEHPAHVASEWLGHSRLLAQDHYRRVTDADFEKASRPHPQPSRDPGGLGGGTKGGAQVAQTVAPHTHEPQTNGCEKTSENSVLLHTDSFSCAAVNGPSVPRAGFEPTTPGVGNAITILIVSPTGIEPAT